MNGIIIVGIVASVLTATSLLPQTVKLVKEKKAEDVSLVMLAVLLGGLGFWIYYGILKEDVIIIFSNIFAVVVNLLTFTLAIIYKKKA